jgi:hypothetical protein
VVWLLVLVLVLVVLRFFDEGDFSGLRRLNKERPTSLEAQNAAQNGSKTTPRSSVFSV